MTDDLKPRMLSACLGIAGNKEEEREISDFILKDNMADMEDVPEDAEFAHVVLTADGGFKVVE